MSEPGVRPADEHQSGLVLTVLDAIQSGIMLVDRTHRIVWANAWVERALAPPDPVVGRHLREVFPGLPESCLERVSDPGCGGECVSPPLAFSLTCGREGWLEIAVSPVDGGEGDSCVAMVHIRDVSQRVRAEQTLRDEIARRRLLVEQSRDGIVVLDQDGGVNEANEQFAKMLGYTMEETASLHVWDWDDISSKDDLLGMLSSVDIAGDHFETRHRRKDGSLYEVEISTNGAIFGGRKYVFCVCRDVTERKRTERERERLIKELQDALAEIKTLRGIVPVCSYCHKIRDDEGFWDQVDVYIRKHSDASVSHGICPECMTKLFPELCDPEEE